MGKFFTTNEKQKVEKIYLLLLGVFAIPSGLFVILVGIDLLKDVLLLQIIFTLFVTVFIVLLMIHIRVRIKTPNFIKSSVSQGSVKNLLNIQNSLKYSGQPMYGKYAKKLIFKKSTYPAFAVSVVSISIIFGILGRYNALGIGENISYVICFSSFIWMPGLYGLYLHINKTYLAPKKFWFLTQREKREYLYFEYEKQNVKHYFFY